MTYQELFDLVNKRGCWEQDVVVCDDIGSEQTVKEFTDEDDNKKTFVLLSERN